MRVTKDRQRRAWGKGTGYNVSTIEPPVVPEPLPSAAEDILARVEAKLKEAEMSEEEDAG